MSLLDIVRSAVTIADTVTKSLQAPVSLERCTGEDAYGNLTYAVAVSLVAIVEWKQQQVRTLDGILAVSRFTVMFLDVAVLATATAGNGVTTKDRIALSTGETGPILSLAGFLDAGTGRPIATQAYL